MKTWTVKLNALNKNNQPYQHTVTAPLALIRDLRNKLPNIIRATPGTQITTNAHPQTTTPLTITKAKHNTYTFEQPCSDWNFTLDSNEIHILDEAIELIDISTPPKRQQPLPTTQQIGDYLHAIDHGDEDYIAWYNKKFS